MAFVIKRQQVVADTWQLLKPATPDDLSAVPATGEVIVPLALWLKHKTALLQRAGKVGVWLDSDQDPAAIADDLARLPLVAVNFSQFGDGRGYSIGRLLRERYGYKNEMRAIGAVVRDHLYYMAGCGFDSFLMRDDQDPAESLTGFADFDEAYQASVTQPQPLFRRRLNKGVSRA